MMQPRHWPDQPPARNRSGLPELMVRFAQRLSADRRSNFSQKAARAIDGRGLCRRVNFSVPRAHPLGKNGAVQVPGLGLKMRDLAAYEDTG
jgi:hypothetical protein